MSEDNGVSWQLEVKLHKDAIANLKKLRAEAEATSAALRQVSIDGQISTGVGGGLGGGVGGGRVPQGGRSRGGRGRVGGGFGGPLGPGGGALGIGGFGGVMAGGLGMLATGAAAMSGGPGGIAGMIAAGAFGSRTVQAFAGRQWGRAGLQAARNIAGFSPFSPLFTNVGRAGLGALGAIGLGAAGGVGIADVYVNGVDSYVGQSLQWGGELFGYDITGARRKERETARGSRLDRQIFEQRFGAHTRRMIEEAQGRNNFLLDSELIDDPKKRLSFLQGGANKERDAEARIEIYERMKRTAIEIANIEERAAAKAIHSARQRLDIAENEVDKRKEALREIKNNQTSGAYLYREFARKGLGPELQQAAADARAGKNLTRRQARLLEGFRNIGFIGQGLDSDANSDANAMGFQRFLGNAGSIQQFMDARDANNRAIKNKQREMADLAQIEVDAAHAAVRSEELLKEIRNKLVGDVRQVSNEEIRGRMFVDRQKQMQNIQRFEGPEALQ